MADDLHPRAAVERTDGPVGTYTRTVCVAVAAAALGSVLWAADTPASDGYVVGKRPKGMTTFFTPVPKPTRMYFEPPPLPPLLKKPVNRGLTWIGTSEYHEFFIVRGKLLAIGGNRAGMMGLGNVEPSAHMTPQRVKLPRNVTMVAAAAGGYQSVGIDSTGSVWSWGHNGFGQRGDGSKSKPGADNKIWGTPIKLTTDAAGKSFAGPADPALQVITTLWFNLARTESGAVYMWGLNGHDGSYMDSQGMIGDGKPISSDKSLDAISVRRPSRVIFPDGTVITHIAASSSMGVAVDKRGRLWTWGCGVDGLGIGNKQDQAKRGVKNGRSSKTLLLERGRPKSGGALGPLPKFVDTTTNTNTNFALDVNGDLWGWGVDGFRVGVVGPSWNPQPYPVRLTRCGNPQFAGVDVLLKAGRKITSVQSSICCTHILIDDGSLWGWGDSAMGTVGDGHIVNYFEVKKMDDGKNHVACSWDWGGTKAVVRNATKVMTEVRYFSTSAFSFHVMAVRKDGTIWSWGRNANGVLGNKAMPNYATWHANHKDFDRYKPIGKSYTPNFFDVPYPLRVDPF